MSRLFGFVAILAAAFGSPAISSAAEAIATAEPASGFRVIAVEVAAERDAPQVCFTLSDRLDKAQGFHYDRFLQVTPPPSTLAVVARDRTLCIEGLTHGASYDVTLREGLPGADGVRLAQNDTRTVAVPNRAPSLAFRGAGTILPRIGSEGLPIRSINVDGVRLRVLRIADRSLVEQIYAGRISQTLSDWDIGERVEKAGKPVWSGEQSITETRNTPMLTPFPIDTVLDGLEHGVYLASAEAVSGRENKASPPKASQWFVVSDLGLTSFVGDDGLLVFVRSLTSAEPVPGVELHLLARNGKEVAQRITGADGIARFDAAVARKGGDESAQALFAYGAGGDFSFLDLAMPSVDLSDRGAGGRVTPGPLDVFLATDRGIYRPGETINLTALVRNADAEAVPGCALVLNLWRPDGFLADRRPVAERGAGGGVAEFTLPTVALPGPWSITAHVNGSDTVVGRLEVAVEDFTPPRLDFTLTADRPALTDGKGATITIDSQTFYGAPAANLAGELSLTLRAAESPFPGHPGFRFGLAQEKPPVVPTELPGFTTNAAGKAVIDLPAPKLPDSSHPLEAVIRGTVFDIGGRAVSRDLVVPVQHQPFAIGVRPRFEGAAVPEGATAGFEVITVTADGAAIGAANLSYELYEEESEYRWFEANGRWDYETIIRDHRVTGGTLAVTTTTPAAIEEPVGAGRYRLEVFDPKSGVATSVRFAAGWWVTPASGNRPDKVEVSVMQPRTRGGDVARIHIRPPYDSQVLIAVADRSIRRTLTRQIPAQGAFLDLPVDPSWTAGVTIIATAYSAVDSVHKTPPRRAIGLGWLAVDPGPHTLKVKLDAPATFEPRRTLGVGVTVRDDADMPLAAGTKAYLTLAAVDDSVLQLSGYAAPDAAPYYLGQRRLGVELRDVYGRLLDTSGAEKGTPSTAISEKDRRRPRSIPSLPERDSPVVALFSGVVEVGFDGTAQVPLVLPDFQGRLRLMAIAWSDARVGHADHLLTIRDRVNATLAAPRFMAPGDRARIELTLDNLTGATGDYQVALNTEGGVAVTDGTLTIPALKRGRRIAVSRYLTALDSGPATVRLEVTGPDGYHLVRSRTLTVRAAETAVVRQHFAKLAPEQSAAVATDLLDGLKPATITTALSLSPLPTLNLPALTADGALPLGGSAERLADQALVLLAGHDALVALGTCPQPPPAAKPGAAEPCLSAEAAEALARQQLQSVLDRLLALQKADGSFGLWSPKAETDPWLTCFVADVLGRTHDAGYRVPETATRLSLEWLKHMLDNGWFEDRDLPARAYGIWLLARVKGLDVGAVQYFQSTFGAKLPGDLARAQVGAALASLGETRGAAEIFERLAGDKATGRTAGFEMIDYGSDLRDRAGVAALAGESGVVPAERLVALTERLTARIPGPDLRLSAQDKAWLALAGRVIADRSPQPQAAMAKAAIDDQVSDFSHPLYRRFEPTAPPKLRNAGAAPLYLAFTVTGLAVEPPVAGERGLTISRSIFDTTGKPVAPSAVRQNQVLVVILEGRSLEPRRQQVLVTDLLPAGLEIETVRLADSAQLGGLSWLGDLSSARLILFRQDRFVAALNLDEAHSTFRLVYLARAVTQGDFAQPGTTVEALDDPAQAARTEAGRIQIRPERE